MSPSNHRFVDTNILLRFLTNDLPEQADKASMLMQRIQSGRETVELSILAAAEIVWTLERFYKLSKSNVASKMSSILKLKRDLLRSSPALPHHSGLHNFLASVFGL